MDHYIDGFVLSVPTDKIEAYRVAAEKAAAVWKEYGALEYREAIGDDLEVPDQVPFPKMAGTQEGETVVMAYIVYASKEARDEIVQKIMVDPRMAEICGEAGAIFDFTRMAYGGFKTLVHA